MKRSHFSLDWKGISFACKAVLACVILGCAVQFAAPYGLSYVKAKTAAAASATSVPVVAAALATTTPIQRDTSAPPLLLSKTPVPKVTAESYLVADIDNGDVYAQVGADTARPIASLTKLITALVADQASMLQDTVTISHGDLMTTDGPESADTKPEQLTALDLFYPLLMESNNHVADALANSYGTAAFVSRMNAEAKTLDMTSTTYDDPSGVSKDNVSTLDDLYRLAVYITDEEPFIWNITATPHKTVTAQNGSSYPLINFNEFDGDSDFIGGKIGETPAAGETMVSVFSVPIDGQTRRITIIILGSDNDKGDTQKLLNWFKGAAYAPTSVAGTPSAAAPAYPTIGL